MNQPGDKVRVKREWLDKHPSSPLPDAGVLEVTADGEMWRNAGEVAVSHQGQVWYVPEEYVEPA